MVLTVKHLGIKGRFANQLFQYAHLRQRAGDDYQCPRWVGQSLFGLDDPPVTSGTKDIGFKFPLDSSWYHERLFRRLFRPTSEWINRVQPLIDAMKKKGPLLGIHLRRGDYGTFKRKSARWCFRALTKWYAAWLAEYIDLIDGMPTVFIATDDPDMLVPSEFLPYRIMRWKQCKNGDFFWDFYTLTQCDYLLIANSTFSFAASMLNEQCESFWRPRLSEERLISYNPWDSNIVLKDELYVV